MACEDLRHVCGACGFKWPARSAYDELVLANANLHDETRRLRTALEEIRATQSVLCQSECHASQRMVAIASGALATCAQAQQKTGARDAREEGPDDAGQ